MIISDEIISDATIYLQLRFLGGMEKQINIVMSAPQIDAVEDLVVHTEETDEILSPLEEDNVEAKDSGSVTSQILHVAEAAIIAYPGGHGQQVLNVIKETTEFIGSSLGNLLQGGQFSSLLASKQKKRNPRLKLLDELKRQKPIGKGD